MKNKFVIGLILAMGIAMLSLSGRTAGAIPKPGKSEVFSALAQLPVAGTTTNVKIYIDGYSTAEDAAALHSALASGGPDALLKALHKSKTLGKIERDGTVGFYNLKFILSKDTPNGRHIYAVADRPIGFLEAFFNTRSKDYPFGILELDLKSNPEKEREKGEGTLIYAAKIKLIDGDKVDIENVTFAPIQLVGVRQL